MLDDAARVANYQAQNDHDRLTPRQHRRVNHKRRHQSARALAARIHEASEKARLRTARKSSAYLPPASR